MPPASVAGALAALDVMREEPERRERLWTNTKRVADGIARAGLRHRRDADAGDSSVDRRAFAHVQRLARAVRRRRVHASDRAAGGAGNACRIRVSMSAEHTDEQIERVLERLRRIWRGRWSPVDVKVALVCDWFHPRVGGIELHLHDLARQLAAPGMTWSSSPRRLAPDASTAFVFAGSTRRARRILDFFSRPGGIRAVGDALAATKARRRALPCEHCLAGALGGATRGGPTGHADGSTFIPSFRRRDLLARAVSIMLCARRHGARAFRR